MAVFNRIVAAIAVALLVLASGGGSARGQAADPVIHFESPIPDGYAMGPMPIRIRLDPATAAVQSVSFTADGRLVCTIERPPFECQWDAGPKIVEHAIRASVLLKDGRRVSLTMRTREAGYAETVDVNAMQLTVTVTDNRGRFVRGLTREDFRVYDEGVLQTLSGFAAENVPLEIFVAVDFSGSMKDAMPTVKAAVKKFLSALRPGDRVTLVGFNDNVVTLARPTADLPARLAAVDRLSPWGGTALYDAIVRSIDQLGRQTGRRALVVFTDGEDLNSRVPEAAAEQRLESSDAVLYPIGQGRAPTMVALKRVLERLALKSGGKAFFEDLEELDAAFSRIVEELSNQYLLSYARPDAAKEGTWRKQRVEIPGRDLKIRARQGYRVVGK